MEKNPNNYKVRLFNSVIYTLSIFLSGALTKLVNRTNKNVIFDASKVQTSDTLVYQNACTRVLPSYTIYIPENKLNLPWSHQIVLKIFNILIDFY